jgi:DNA mismatch repair ATPase MutS
VARLAGLPAPLLERARELLTKLEAGSGPQRPARRRRAETPAEDESRPSQLPLI